MLPCLGCGTPTEGSRCADCRLPSTRPQLSRKERHRTAAWDRLSRRLRPQSPFCESPGCTATTDLTVDHIIPIDEAPELAFEPLNCRVLCRSCNSRRRNTCTDAERQAVHAAIAARKRRATSA